MSDPDELEAAEADFSTVRPAGLQQQHLPGDNDLVHDVGLPKVDHPGFAEATERPPAGMNSPQRMQLIAVSSAVGVERQSRLLLQGRLARSILPFRHGAGATLRWHRQATDKFTVCDQIKDPERIVQVLDGSHPTTRSKGCGCRPGRRPMPPGGREQAEALGLTT